ncbi:MAG: hypothetical protein HQK52_21790 [Oligoflexia bacterium]|nr:hypothetical protein [Oligoflexia bacterium]
MKIKSHWQILLPLTLLILTLTSCGKSDKGDNNSSPSTTTSNANPNVDISLEMSNLKRVYFQNGNLLMIGNDNKIYTYTTTDELASQKIPLKYIYADSVGNTKQTEILSLKSCEHKPTKMIDINPSILAIKYTCIDSSVDLYLLIDKKTGSIYPLDFGTVHGLNNVYFSVEKIFLTDDKNNVYFSGYAKNGLGVNVVKITLSEGQWKSEHLTRKEESVVSFRVNGNGDIIYMSYADVKADQQTYIGINDKMNGYKFKASPKDIWFGSDNRIYKFATNTSDHLLTYLDLASDNFMELDCKINRNSYSSIISNFSHFHLSLTIENITTTNRQTVDVFVSNYGGNGLVINKDNTAPDTFKIFQLPKECIGTQENLSISGVTSAVSLQNTIILACANNSGQYVFQIDPFASDPSKISKRITDLDGYDIAEFTKNVKGEVCFEAFNVANKNIIFGGIDDKGKVTTSSTEFSCQKIYL